MKTLNMLLALSFILAAGTQVQAATKLVVTKAKTNHDFEDKLVNGQYQYPDEATAKVDDEKLLDDLIGVRKNFKDRLKESAQRR